ncbi:MAG: 1-deoxy-D-xylulose-5-phosphate reductoisomerase [Clostridia bacterium]|nr:1-deoxy-D-xylulose-5-phosphate reductoisomerase [Clostridia bacterium]
MKKRIAIIGSTGSIGTQALQVAALQRDEIEIAALSAGKNAALLAEQCAAFHPSYAALAEGIPEAGPGTETASGAYAALEGILDRPLDGVLIAVTGFAGLRSVLAAIERKIPVFLANKESLVAGGDLVMKQAKENGVPILPVDSEHSAIFQCLLGRGDNEPSRIVLTASGGPFRTFSKEQIRNATVEMALKHPSWNMGRKITIDSASMMNKALEVIEAHHLFGMPAEKIGVLIHPQSIVHSYVEFADGAVIAQMGRADMRVPIGFAFRYPERVPTGVCPPDFAELGQLTFEKWDEEKFPAIRLAYEALSGQGGLPTVLNAANEAAVGLLFEGGIAFWQIAPLVERTMQAFGDFTPTDEEDILRADLEVRRLVVSDYRRLLQGIS